MKYIGRIFEPLRCTPAFAIEPWHRYGRVLSNRCYGSRIKCLRCFSFQNRNSIGEMGKWPLRYDQGEEGQVSHGLHWNVMRCRAIKLRHVHFGILCAGASSGMRFHRNPHRILCFCANAENFVMQHLANAKGYFPILSLLHAFMS